MIYKIKNILFVFIYIFFTTKTFALIEVDITRGNLNPLPIAVSPLSIDANSKKSFNNILNIKDLGSDISSIVENNLKTSGLFNPLIKMLFYKHQI